MTVFIWGGSTSVGACAIQLAVAAGYEVATTASPKNFEYVRRLGARHVFDYNAPDVVDKICKVLRHSDLAGVLSISPGSGASCIKIASQCPGRRIVAMASAPLPVDDAPLTGQFMWKATRLPRLASGFAGLAIRAKMSGVATTSIWGTALVNEPLGKTIFKDFLEPALASGQFVAVPEAIVVGKSLSDIPSALIRLRQGVSAKKVVVSLAP